MNVQLQNLIDRQHQRMRELREDAADLANSVADEVWDKFEVEVDDATGDSYMFDLASSTQLALSSMLALNYDEAFGRHVLSLFERQQKELREAGAGDANFDSARIDLTGLRKSLKLKRHADDLISQAMERAKPRLIGMLFLARDPCSDAWDRELRDNARRVRSNLLELRGKVCEVIREETTTVIHTARLTYINMLDALRETVAVSEKNLDTV